MRKYGRIFALALCALCAARFGLPAQDAGKTAHYEITAMAGAGSSVDALAKEMEQRFDVYAHLFHFDPAALPAPLKVRVFADQAAYDAYIQSRVGEAREGAVYLHYRNRDSRELVIHKGGEKEAAMLAHQSFIQYLRAYIDNPPAWIREGFAIFFNTLSYDPVSSSLRYEENLSWLETIKGLGDKRPTIESVMGADGSAADAPGNFQICAWALVSFFLNSGNEDYFRTLAESFMLLKPEASAADNGEAVRRHIALWINADAMSADYESYLAARKTFNELMQTGRKAYAEKDRANAELNFLSALDQDPRHYAPYYYLGLLFYEEKNYEMASEYYRISLEYGADEGLVSYALGLNALQAGNKDEAAEWLQKAAKADPGRYKNRAEELLKQIGIKG
jgi:tetratricopeptide (TPR) repeat protein